MNMSGFLVINFGPHFDKVEIVQQAVGHISKEASLSSFLSAPTSSSMVEAMVSKS